MCTRDKRLNIRVSDADLIKISIIREEQGIRGQRNSTHSASAVLRWLVDDYHKRRARVRR